MDYKVCILAGGVSKELGHLTNDVHSSIMRERNGRSGFIIATKIINFFAAKLQGITTLDRTCIKK